MPEVVISEVVAGGVQKNTKTQKHKTKSKAKNNRPPTSPHPTRQ